jgi:MFS family permease
MTATKTSSRGAALAVLCLAAFTINLDTTIVNVTLPSLVRELGATTSELQWVVGAPPDVRALVLAGGSLGDRFGRKARCCRDSRCSVRSAVVGWWTRPPRWWRSGR